jgi:gas vesicle protein
MENSTENTIKIVGSLLVGVALGGVLGILYAPHKGTKTRRMIIDKTEDLTHQVNEKINDFLEEARNELHMVKEKAMDFVSNDKVLDKKH